MHAHRTLFAGLICLLLSGPAFPKVFKCTDSGGEITYQSKPCPEGDSAKQVDIVERVSPPPESPDAPSTGEAGAEVIPASAREEELRRREERELTRKRRECERLESDLRRARRERAEWERRVIAECERRRETYCNRSAEQIAKLNRQRDDRKMLTASPRIRRNYFNNQKDRRHPPAKPGREYRNKMRDVGCDRL